MTKRDIRKARKAKQQQRERYYQPVRRQEQPKEHRERVQ